MGDVPQRRVTYVVSNELAHASSLLPSNPKRSAVVHSLVKAYGLLDSTKNSNLRVVAPVAATHKDLCVYHDGDFVDALLATDASKHETDALFGLEDDCPRFPNLARYVSLVSGGTLTAAHALRDGFADVAIAWDGGRHHAQKARAAGFCYANDCILSIMALRKLGRVLYIDLDLHFADAVAAAFPFSPSSNVLVLSLHHAGPGFYPAVPSGSSSTLPLLAGASTTTFARIWNEGLELVCKAFKPDAVVVQCGADGLAGDPCNVWNWSLGGSGGMGDIVSRVLDWRIPTLLLGGGGYSSANTARAWTYLTSIALGSPLDLESHIPDHVFFPLFAPSFTLDVAPGNARDENWRNDSHQLEEIVRGLQALAGSMASRQESS
ncbi:Arginase/deacetylase [Exidia glandulosa HHB12029]|uniref:Histone deacetylase 8 n=1 Tax=Exidia glandulosa HHB12029 TaxID=1314781 RepID=A0A165NG59_EXIGL|nr:Arginase/deacetylase [Exidia glandulosa HHB12029]